MAEWERNGPTKEQKVTADIEYLKSIMDLDQEIHSEVETTIPIMEQLKNKHYANLNDMELENAAQLSIINIIRRMTKLGLLIKGDARYKQLLAVIRNIMTPII